MRYIFFLLFFLIIFPIFADRSPVNFVIPYDPFIVPPIVFSEQQLQCSFYTEFGVKNGYALNNHGDRVNPLHIWGEFENVVTMLDNSNDPAVIEIRNEIGELTSKDSGKIALSAKFKEKFATVFALKGTITNYFYLAIYLPFYGYALRDVEYQDYTSDLSASDRIIKKEITNNLNESMMNLANLDLSSWSRAGTGDTTIALEWYKNFRQDRELLKEVSTQIHAGITIPTCKRANVNKLLAFSFGNNGAFAIPFGAAIDLRYRSCFHIGLDVLLIHTFAATQRLRIKTAFDQTEILLLNVANVYVDFGLTQRFLLYASLIDLIPHCTIMAIYDFEKQGDDTIYVKGNEFQTNVAQSGLAFEDRTMHQFVGSFGYQQDVSIGTVAASFVTRIPFNGKRVLLVPTIGFSVSFAF